MRLVYRILRVTYRFAAFWAIVILVVTTALVLLPWFNWAPIAEAYAGIMAGIAQSDIDQVINATREAKLAYGLALLIVFSGGGLLAAFGVMHTLAVTLSLWRARRILKRSTGPIAFAREYESAILPRLCEHRLIGHAWREFDDTLLKDKVSLGGPIENTVRPQSFVNYALLRDKLPGLKIIGSVAGYFVGIGLLLTFIGIVLALHEAGKATAGEDVAAMQSAMSTLLAVASFKFATSIAGLFTSIVFAIASRFLIAGMEGALTGFCEDAENQLKYVSPQWIAAESLKANEEQRDQLKEINSDRYFSKLADTVSPLFEAAMSRAMAPVSDKINLAVEQLKSTSQTGLADMTKDFAAALHGSAGAEMKELQEALREIQVSMVATHKGMQGGGEEFSRRLSEAADNLNRVVGEAGARLEGSAEQNRAGLAEVVAAFRETMDAANSRIETELGNAAVGASGKMEEAMGRVLERLEGQVGSLMSGLADFQASTADEVEQTRARLRETQEGMVAAMASASSEASEAMKVGIADAFARIAAEIDRFQAAMGRGETALAHQAGAIGDATSRTREVADAFAETAQQVRVAASPLLQSADRMAQATSEISAVVTQSVTSMEAANSASGELSQTLGKQTERLTDLWQGYRAQFDKVDEDLARAVTALSEATSAQSEKLAQFTGDTDANLAQAVGRLGTFVADLRENTDEISESVRQLVDRMGPPMAAE